MSNRRTNFLDRAPSANHDPKRGSTAERPVELDDANRAVIAAMDADALITEGTRVGRLVDAGTLSPFAHQIAVAMVLAINERMDAAHANAPRPVV